MALLDAATVTEKLKSLDDWKLAGDSIVRDYGFADFAEAMRFVNQVAQQAEQAGHHPDIDIRYNKVRLSLSSHDAGGLTNRDLNLAAVLNTLDNQHSNPAS